MKHFCSFSEAIRAGAGLRPQCFGFYFDEGGSCAFGAGIEAVFGNTVSSPNQCLLLYPYLDNASGPCPCCGAETNSSISTMIFHLNDDHKWTREQIAKWLEIEEEKIGFTTLVESESSSKSLQRSDVTCVSVNG